MEVEEEQIVGEEQILGEQMEEEERIQIVEIDDPKQESLEQKQEVGEIGPIMEGN